MYRFRSESGLAIILLLLLVGVALVIAFILIGRGPVNQTESGQDTLNRQHQTLKGVSLSPKSFESTDFKDFFNQASQTGKVVTWAGDWQELANKNSAAHTVAQLSDTYGYEPVIITSFYTNQVDAPPRLLRPLNDENVENYVNQAADFAEAYKPRYMGLGIEINVIFEESPDQFERFVGLFNQAYDAVKSVSPDTKVFTVWQYERLQGLRGGLFGETTNRDQHHWQLLDRLNKADLFAFTSYPYLIYKTPGDIPDDYYERIEKQSRKPTAFTEIGWPSRVVATGWDSSPGEQATFIKRFGELTKPLSPRLVIWPFLYDQGAPVPFDSISLFNSDGEPKPGFGAWQRLDYEYRWERVQ